MSLMHVQGGPPSKKARSTRIEWRADIQCGRYGLQMSDYAFGTSQTRMEDALSHVFKNLASVDARVALHKHSVVEFESAGDELTTIESIAVAFQTEPTASERGALVASLVSLKRRILTDNPYHNPPEFFAHSDEKCAEFKKAIQKGLMFDKVEINDGAPYEPGLHVSCEQSVERSGYDSYDDDNSDRSE